MRRVLFLLPVAVFMGLCGYFVWGLERDPNRLLPVIVNTPVAPIHLPAIQGRVNTPPAAGDDGLRTVDLTGQVSLVNIFGSWCVACLNEHTFLMQLNAQNILPIHAINWDEKHPLDAARWLAKHGDPYTRIGADPDSEGAVSFGVTGAPETFIIDGAGIIRYKQIGPITMESWQTTLYPLIRRLQDERQGQ